MAAVIGQHPQCYGLPELHIFMGDTLGETLDRYEGTGRAGLYGLERTLAELHDGIQTDETILTARAWILEHRHLTPLQIMEHIQERVGDRILVEKSSGFGSDGGGMMRAIRAYPRASFMQLLRHPRSRGISHKAALDSQKSRKLLERVMGVSTDFEAKWTDTHRMIHEFGRQLAPGQMLRLNGETLLRDLQLYLPQICEWLDIRSDEDAIAAMLRPEDSPYSCVGPANAPGGANRGFLTNPQLDMEKLARLKAPTLEAPMEWAPNRHFSDTTRALAHYYGYR